MFDPTADAVPEPHLITVSYLQSIYTHPERGRCLHRSKITDFGAYEGWGIFVDNFLTSATMPRPATNKADAYGWTPTVFAVGEDPHDPTVIAWRKGRFAADTVSLFTADLDNQHADRRMITIDAVAATLTALGLNYLLYTSFSHTSDRHKVRIVCPVTRDLTPDEAFKVHLWFTAAFDRQLDGSIYDPGDFLYGPPLGSDIRLNCDGAALDVDAFLTLHDELPEEDRTWITRSGSNIHRPLTADVEAKAAMMAAIPDVSSEAITITNPAIFNPAWMTLLTSQYQGGSRSRTLRGLIAKVWVKSAGNLTLGDLWSLYRELDAHYGGYCLRTYGRVACERDIKSAMTAVGAGPLTVTDPPATTTTDTLKATLIAKEHARLLKRRA